MSNTAFKKLIPIMMLLVAGVVDVKLVPRVTSNVSNCHSPCQGRILLHRHTYF